MFCTVLYVIYTIIIHLHTLFILTILYTCAYYSAVYYSLVLIVIACLHTASVLVSDPDYCPLNSCSCQKTLMDLRLLMLFPLWPCIHLRSIIIVVILFTFLSQSLKQDILFCLPLCLIEFNHIVGERILCTPTEAFYNSLLQMVLFA